MTSTKEEDASKLSGSYPKHAARHSALFRPTTFSPHQPRPSLVGPEAGSDGILNLFREGIGRLPAVSGVYLEVPKVKHRPVLRWYGIPRPKLNLSGAS